MLLLSWGTFVFISSISCYSHARGWLLTFEQHDKERGQSDGIKDGLEQGSTNVNSGRIFNMQMFAWGL
jgi:hypothetical protein